MTMKKLTAMFLSLLMCFSLLAVTAQAASLPADSSIPGIVGIGKTPLTPGGDKDPDEPGISVQGDKSGLPGPVDNTPTD